MIVRLTILGEPCSKANSRMIVRFGDRPASIKSAKARGYEATAQAQIPASARAMLTGPVRATLHLFYASQRPDLDPSVVLDVLQAKRHKQSSEYVRHGVYLNDRQVRELHVYHAIDRANPRAEIEVETLTAQQADMIDPPPPRPGKRTPKPQPEVRAGENPF